MYTLILAFVVVFGITIMAMGRHRYNTAWDIFSTALMLGVCCTLCALIVLMLTNAIAPVTDTVLIKTEKLIALKDNTGIHGSFFLGSGSVDSEPVYYYLHSTSDGGIMQKTISVQYATLYNAEQPPRIEHYGYVLKPKFKKWLLNLKCCDHYYKIYIPEGSIIHGYRIDLE